MHKLVFLLIIKKALKITICSVSIYALTEAELTETTCFKGESLHL